EFGSGGQAQREVYQPQRRRHGTEFFQQLVGQFERKFPVQMKTHEVAGRKAHHGRYVSQRQIVSKRNPEKGKQANDGNFDHGQRPRPRQHQRQQHRGHAGQQDGCAGGAQSSLFLVSAQAFMQEQATGQNRDAGNRQQRRDQL